MSFYDISSKSHWQSVPVPTANTDRTRLSLVTTWIPCWEIDGIYDSLHSAASREEQRAEKILCFAFMGSIKALYKVGRDGVFKIYSPAQLHSMYSMMESFHKNMQGTARYDGTSSDSISAVALICDSM